MDKYLKPIRKRRIYTHTILVTQECLDNSNQRSGSNTHETYTFPKIWDSQATEYRHLVMQTKTTGTNQEKKYTCDDHKKLRQCTAKRPSTKEIVTAWKIWHTYQNKKSSQVGYMNCILTGYTRLGINGHQVDPRLDGVLSVHFSLGDIRQQQVKRKPLNSIGRTSLGNRGRHTTSTAPLQCRIWYNYGQNLKDHNSKQSTPQRVKNHEGYAIVTPVVKDPNNANLHVQPNQKIITINLLSISDL